MQTNITRQDLYRLAADRDAYTRGYNLYTSGSVFEFETQTSRDAELVSAVVIENDIPYRIKADIALQSNAVIGHSCPCSHHFMWRGACAHVLAALFSATEGSREPSLTMLSPKLLRVFENAYLAETSRAAADNAGDGYGDGHDRFRLYPQLRFDDDMALVGFAVGRDKRYVVKDINEFLQNIRDGRFVRYGRGLAFQHIPEAFDAQSLAMIRFLRRIMDSLSEFAALTGAYDHISASRYLPLPREFIDGFFAICESCDVRTPTGLAKAVPVTDEPPPAVVAVVYENALPVIASKPLVFHTLLGRRHGYFIDDKIRIVDKNYIRTVAPLLRAVNETHGQRLGVRAENAYSFATAVLPALRRFGALAQEEDAPTEFIPLRTEAYLDYAAGRVSCTLLFGYGDVKINPAEKSAPSLPRDSLRERRTLAFLSDAGFVQDGTVYTLDGDDALFGFYSAGLGRLRTLAEVFTTDEFAKKSYLSTTKARVGVRLEGDLIQLDFDAGYTAAELLEALESYRIKKRYHRLTDGRFIDLTTVGDAEEVLSRFELSKKDARGDTVRLPKYRALYLHSILERKQLAAASALQAIADDFGRIGDPAAQANVPPVPAAMEDILRPYQKIGYEWMRTLAAYRFGGILADEMGLGKTIQVIALVLAELEHFTKPSVVVAPTSLIYNWEHEFKRFAPAVETVVVAGAASARRELLQKPAHVFITTYDTLKRDIAHYHDRTFKYVVADEAQYMKNPATQNASAIKELQADARFALTGTPIENALSELWSIFDFVMPGYLYSAGKFMRLFETPIMKHGDQEKTAELRKQLAPFILRRLKKDVLTELPEKSVTNLYAEMEDEQRRLYAAYMAKARGLLGTAGQMEILALLTRLRQICCHPALFIEGFKEGGEQSVGAEPPVGSGKLELAMDTIVSAVDAGHRLLLFSQFTSMLSILTARLEQAGLAYFYLDGQTPASERLQLTKRFNDGERQVFVISLKAGGAGLNLTGADVVIHYDPWWNPAVMDQAADRAHRYGQDKTVQVINIVTRDSIEERILLLQERKKGLVDSVITEGGSFLSRMTAEEIRDLFNE